MNHHVSGDEHGDEIRGILKITEITLACLTAGSVPVRWIASPRSEARTLDPPHRLSETHVDILLLTGRAI